MTESLYSGKKHDQRTYDWCIRFCLRVDYVRIKFNINKVDKIESYVTQDNKGQFTTI